ncbi:hypothetical protein BZA05DRAFT_471025 [Tricharina praecox]|uniref:uncharacterized protein n=1 Tax=Tricharina praecox TaxID=43433 RepID=UPI0022212687|nr:uncharacterized protein BZA05DRAFT_471025 [Tricharina praecox]KAI5856873.1 hypothetical protein BZA05DRAFT_471025 [Tricharina praecox]
MTTVNGTTIRQGTHSETICTDATWTSVVKFILLNYVTHVFTIMLQPGAVSSVSLAWAVGSLFMPLLGTLRALGMVLSPPAFLESSFISATRCGALCIVVGFKGEDCVVPTAFADANMKLNDFALGFHDSAQVHGYYPTNLAARASFPRRIFDSFRSLFQRRRTDTGEIYYRIAPIPREGHAHGLGDDVNSMRKMEIAASYSFVQGIAAIAQIFFASKELYDARGVQIDRYGYAAYGLTVIPYLWMSFLNLLAAIMRPRYTHMYLLHYGGPHCPCTPPDSSFGADSHYDTTFVEREEIGKERVVLGVREVDKELQDKVIGAVGVLHIPPADFKINNYERILRSLKTPKYRYFMIAMLFLYSILWLLSMIVPYVIIYVMTGFKAAGSTSVQRFSVVGWLAIGQALAIFLPFVNILGGKKTLMPYLAVTVTLLAAVGIFSVVNVSKMILESGVCIKI